MNKAPYFRVRFADGYIFRIAARDVGDLRHRAATHYWLGDEKPPVDQVTLTLQRHRRKAGLVHYDAKAPGFPKLVLGPFWSSDSPPPADIQIAGSEGAAAESEKGKAKKKKKKKKKKQKSAVDPEEAHLKNLAEQRGSASDQFNLGMFYLAKAKGAQPRYPELASMKNPMREHQEEASSAPGEAREAAMSVVKEVRQMQRDNKKLRRKMSKASETTSSSYSSGSRKLSLSAEDVQTTETHRQGIQWLLQAHEGGHVEATIALANQLVQADASARVAASGTNADDASVDLGQRTLQAIGLYESVSTHPDACFNLGKLYYDGVPGCLPADQRKAVRWFQSAVDAGDPAAMYFLGHLCRVGKKLDATADSTQNWIVPVDAKRSFELMDTAARAGHSEASMYLCMLFRDGDDSGHIAPDGIFPGPGESHPERMWEYLRLAKSQGNADAMYLLAGLYLHGDEVSGLQADAPRALRLYLEAGEAGPHSEALCSAAAMFFHGLGTHPEIGTRERLKRAYELYQHAVDADSDNKEAWRNLASCYYHGHGVQKDIDLARYILKTVLVDNPTNDEEEKR
eukprot:g3652.t1